ncbi:JAB domain-containing protein [Qipengyuania sp. S6317L1]|uniref:JAB domain-containing protein n=1 Tax=Qipengyuania sp. S6317L1 TaxID=2926410 RepID=UPI00248C3F40|nr:JAB domain-containing protein [Qipengyuania sp. S6317L1]
MIERVITSRFNRSPVRAGLASASRSFIRTAGDSDTIDLLRAMVIKLPFEAERCHVLFVNEGRSYLGDASIGSGGARCLSLRMRDIFSKALSLRAHGIVIAHNHPSGQCRPSRSDIVSTRRLEQVATALDIELLDHLIFTQGAVYSMRAGAIHEYESRQPVLSR